MNERQKIVILILALVCNFTFLLTADLKASSHQQNAACKHAYGKDSLETLKYISLLKDDFKMKDYEMAYQDLRYLLNNAPCAYKGTYIMGPSIITALLNMQKYALRKQKLLDTLFSLYPKRIEYFGEEGPVKARWAYNISKSRPNNYKEALNLYARYIELEGENIEDVLYIKDYMNQALLAYKNKTWTKAQASEIWSKLMAISMTHEIRFIKDSARFNEWDATLDYILQKSKTVINGGDLLFPKGSLNGLTASDSTYILLRTAIKLFETMGAVGNNSPGYLEILKSYYKLYPSISSAESLAKYYERKKDTKMMNTYYLSAIELSKDKQTQETLYSNLAKKNIKDLNLAKTFADKALALNPSNGICLIINGLYIYHNKCGDKFDQAMAACAAVDVFMKAFMVDNSVFKEAKIQIAKYEKLYPLKSDAFFRGLKNNDPYTIKCSGITTEVRTR
jgi:hypothetical protein